MQGTTVEGTIQQLFEGHHMNYIECINVEYKSDRKESFYGTLPHMPGERPILPLLTPHICPLCVSQICSWT